ncbi:hypothetical protein [Salinarimonas soli]|uniref:Uncharacterized protein n=1 Tax=Salinarimonas soli TaxID=1638099 RepID=A0A5B2V9V0_9HYPH|nr:hypothetical protein [Salinarimonas soli]KAA2235355.1 hypothetical protein F0L46_20295 [Salinarimonas soli]
MEGRPSLVSTTLKVSLAVVGVSVLAANWLSGGIDRGGASRLAASVAEPATTGALRDGFSGVRLDPCAAARKP